MITLFLLWITLSHGVCLCLAEVNRWFSKVVLLIYIHIRIYDNFSYSIYLSNFYFLSFLNFSYYDECAVIYQSDFCFPWCFYLYTCLLAVGIVFYKISFKSFDHFFFLGCLFFLLFAIKLQIFYIFFQYRVEFSFLNGVFWHTVYQRFSSCVVFYSISTKC